MGAVPSAKTVSSMDEPTGVAHPPCQLLEIESTGHWSFKQKHHWEDNMFDSLSRANNLPHNSCDGCHQTCTELQSCKPLAPSKSASISQEVPLRTVHAEPLPLVHPFDLIWAKVPVHASSWSKQRVR